MKGQNRLFNRFGGREPRIVVNMKEQRDESLMWRYFYYMELKRLRYDDIIGALSKDFFLGENTVILYLANMQTRVSNLFAELPSFSKVLRMNERFNITIRNEEKLQYIRKYELSKNNKKVV
jgi:hypothetical protein